jgi:predicted RNA binding protein YcfA (HicA-like mRNA interferase family)
VRIPRNVYGRDLADHLCKQWEYRESHQTGSHIILDSETPSHHRIPIPAHKPIRVGTLSAILQAIARHKNVTRDDILRGL